MDEFIRKLSCFLGDLNHLILRMWPSHSFQVDQELVWALISWIDTRNPVLPCPNVGIHCQFFHIVNQSPAFCFEVGPCGFTWHDQCCSTVLFLLIISGGLCQKKMLNALASPFNGTEWKKHLNALDKVSLFQLLWQPSVDTSLRATTWPLVCSCISDITGYPILSP